MIRQYQSSDSESVLNVWESASRIAHSFLDDDFFEEEREQIRTAHLPAAETWVSENNGLIDGFISLVGNEVGAIFVSPDAQRSGTGRALLAKAQSLRGNLEVEVFERNSIGRQFYEKHGFDFLERRVFERTGDVVLRLGLAARNSLQGTLDP